MAEKCFESVGIGKLTSDEIERNALPLKTIDFVRRQLPAWHDDPDRPNEQSEHKLNSDLCKFLNSSRTRSNFPMAFFHHEEPQSTNRRVDLSALPDKPMLIGAKLYTIRDPFIVFECKRLPAPSKDREKEYVTGGKEKTSGGIQRFKLGHHGAELDLVAMIGYVQERSFGDWHHKINEWILELASDTTADTCVWNANEILEPLHEYVTKNIASYQSVHIRTRSKSNDEIKIHHLWIAMNIGQTQKDLD